ncbi:hypothetical protein [Fulvimarina sp. MAC3]|uniref:hypothetical protein n=1 Tax=Fulvimarina sp. MAC3 TaxID=3148887 RepID=UPI0031FD7998
MALELFAAIALALSVGGIVYFLRKISGGRLPKTTIPLFAALALVGFAVWGDYSWASRTASALPDRLVVVDEISQSNLWRPWSFIFPVSERFVAADIGGAQRNENDPGKVRVELYYMERRVPARRQTVVIDCSAKAAAPDAGDNATQLRDRVCAAVAMPETAPSAG